jgi:hypothetical protein
MQQSAAPIPPGLVTWKPRPLNISIRTVAPTQKDFIQSLGECGGRSNARKQAGHDDCHFGAIHRAYSSVLGVIFCGNYLGGIPALAVIAIRRASTIRPEPRGLTQRGI